MQTIAHIRACVYTSTRLLHKICSWRWYHLTRLILCDSDSRVTEMSGSKREWYLNNRNKESYLRRYFCRFHSCFIIDTSMNWVKLFKAVSVVSPCITRSHFKFKSLFTTFYSSIFYFYFNTCSICVLMHANSVLAN